MKWIYWIRECEALLSAIAMRWDSPMARYWRTECGLGSDVPVSRWR